MKQLSFKDIFFIGLMVFALFFGAGNMIFPPELGKESGTEVWTAIFGFLITGVGLPLLGVIAIAISGSNLRDLSNRVHPIFGMIFTAVCYLVIGPFFAIPRTGAVAHEIGITPFLSDSVNPNGWPLFIFSIIFFGITLWLSLNPTKLVDRIGKILTPILLIVIAIIVIKGIIDPIGTPGAPVNDYKGNPFFTGFLNGYLTMDAIASLIFGIIVINTIKQLGVTNKKVITRATIGAGVVAAIGLALVYITLAFLGATSREAVGPTSNGGQLLTVVASILYGTTGQLLLGVAITFACLTTAIGLVTSCAEYFNQVLPKIPYKWFVVIFTVFSAFVANIGLTQLIAFSTPVLTAIYPLTIVLIALTFINKLAAVPRAVYAGALIGAGIISIFDGLKQAGIHIPVLESWLSHLPLNNIGIGWLIPSIVCGLIGLLLVKLRLVSQVESHA
ncbi:LIVCS family branched-chain amino acid:cation transporter [Scopulibacillus darangshiensis]|uniref:Branched-chain amino acid transport system carrier protein n=1 Tax=Scopulibacillus darangshiensis TaxID=442528 RepID=A0A4V2SNC0_9BACL|nr:branched-chain amino acid transport system II carrier protein [Scopulibacillus darangshiensis]TCP30576.1 LIVCS family branched-chain amino acid:cation transporter [Scopulibacillus darangshiensis]